MRKMRLRLPCSSTISQDLKWNSKTSWESQRAPNIHRSVPSDLEIYEIKRRMPLLKPVKDLELALGQLRTLSVYWNWNSAFVCSFVLLAKDESLAFLPLTSRSARASF